MSATVKKQQAIAYTLGRMEDCLIREQEVEIYRGRAKTERERDLLRALASFNRELYRTEFRTSQLWHDLPPRFFDRFPDDFWEHLDGLHELQGVT